MVTRSANDGGYIAVSEALSCSVRGQVSRLTEHCSRRIITSETGLAHTRAAIAVSLLSNLMCISASLRAFGQVVETV